MLRKLFDWVAPESKHAPPSLPSPAADEIPEEEPRDDVKAAVEDKWASLPADVLVEILLYLNDPAAVFNCAGVCKPWGLAIMDNASTLGFYPLLGVFHTSRYAACLRRTPPGPFHSAVLPWKNDDDDGDKTAAAHSLIPASSSGSGTGSGGVFRGLYRELLCSRDGFVLLMARSGGRRHYRTQLSLCLCNPITGHCTFLRPADTGRRTSYILLTGHRGGDQVVPPRVLAVQTRARYDNLEFVYKFRKGEALRYQVFSGDGDGGGKWGPVKSSIGEVGEGLCVWMRGRSTVVCRDADADVVYWLAGPAPNITCALALDVRTGRTWTTEELPPQCRFWIRSPADVVLATSDDGRRLSLVQSLCGPEITVWVLTGGDDGWTLQQTITGDVPIPRCISLSAFCPRSRCVVGASWESKQEFLIDLRNGPCPPVRRIGSYKGLDCWPYEIDSSRRFTYLNKN